jgi:hypothetical protein
MRAIVHVAAITTTIRSLEVGVLWDELASMRQLA